MKQKQDKATVKTKDWLYESISQFDKSPKQE